MDFFSSIFTFEDKQAKKIGTTNATSGACTRHSPFSCSFEAIPQQIWLSPGLFQGQPASLLPQAFLGPWQASHVSYTQDVWPTRMLLPNVKLTFCREMHAVITKTGADRQEFSKKGEISTWVRLHWRMLSHTPRDKLPRTRHPLCHGIWHKASAFLLVWQSTRNPS